MYQHGRVEEDGQQDEEEDGQQQQPDDDTDEDGRLEKSVAVTAAQYRR